MFDNAQLNSLAGDSKSFIPVTWWLHIGCAKKVNVLVCGDLDIHSIRLIASLSTKVFLQGFEKTSESEHINNIEFIKRSTIPDYKYDAVIINQRVLEVPISDKELKSIIDGCLTENATICMYEMSRNLKSYIHAPISFLTDCFKPGRQQQLAAISGECKLNRYPSISYTPRPYESLLPGKYHNNKNIFLLKEKLKSSFLKSVFSRLITNTDIWTWCKSKNSPTLLNQLYESLGSMGIPWHGNEIEILKILYRPGKIIISLSSKPGSSPEYIVVIAIDNSSESQRDNEEIAVNYLKENSAINPLTSRIYKSMPFGLFKIYCMSEIDGITVDVNNASLRKMTENAFKCIMLYSKELIQADSGKDVKKLSDNYFDSFKRRYSNFDSEIETIDRFLKTIDYSKISCVFMHGDAKLENFILDSKFNVVSIIDLELAEIKGLPLLDLYYLIVYNHNMQNNRQFNLSYIKLLNNDLEPYELQLISNYCNQLSISEYHQSVLKVLFFIHHYSRRFRALAAERQYQTAFGQCLTETCQYIKKFNEKQGQLRNE